MTTGDYLMLFVFLIFDISLVSLILHVKKLTRRIEELGAKIDSFCGDGK